MMEVKETKNTVDEKEIPSHNCKQHRRVLEETHGLNSLHNITVARVWQCEICGKKYEQYDPKGL
ncbi:MAG: hypothetical protein IPM56_11075 [Ignavibacteriales bacterium]|nr:MAG: hypothetical protein IPM56_11075 [Ignavibacteriales bacterium]